MQRRSLDVVAGRATGVPVADIQSAQARLVERDVKTESEPHDFARMPCSDLWLAMLRDSEGNIMAFMSEVRH